MSRTLLAAAIAGIAWGTAQAQTAPAARDPESGAQIEEVIVTAQRTPELASRTPVAINVRSGQQLQEDGTDRPSALARRMPDVHLDGAADGLRITIRGVSNADTTEKGDPSAAFMLDGVYIARPQSQNLSFYDIDRVEVLRGPQGTLYGRNTTAGVVNVISNTPQPHLEGAFATELGNYNSRKASAMLNVPAGPALALRAAVSANRHDSYLSNAQGTPHSLGLDRDDRSARLSARLVIQPGASLLLRHDRSIVRDNNDSIVPDTNFFTDIGSGTPTWYAASTAQRLTNGFVPPNGAPEQGFSHKATRGTSAELSWDVPHATVHYLASRRNYSHDALANFYYRIVPGFALGVRQNFSGDYAQDSHELRLATRGGGRLAAQAGFYYFSEESNVVYSFRDLELLGLPPYYVFPSGPTTAHSRAVFGQASYQFDGGLRL
ncbi:MAG TPA: TonB-dependent receptor plug domain-containing protein, partial [Telluria sp.]